MGKSSKPVIGYHYRPAFQHGLTIGPIDAFLEFRGGDKTAWQGELTASGTITINAPNLWGGEKDQGGIVGDVDIMFGEPDQLPNPYLVSVFGDKTAAWRGFTTVVFKGGRYGAMNPYPQKASYKIRQIFNGWEGECWYPEKAAIDFGAGTAITGGVALEDLWKYRVEAPGSTADYSSPGYNDTSWPLGQGGFGNSSDDPVGTPIEPAVGKAIWLRRRVAVPASLDVSIEVIADDGVWLWWNGDPIVTAGTSGVYVIPAADVRPINDVALKVMDSVPTGSPTEIYAGMSLSWDGASQGKAINPAHVLYYSRTNGDMGREPTSNINEASLQAAADKLYAEGFGICPKWDPAAESVEDFEKRICKLIGGSFTRSLEDGQWYLDLARGDYVLEDLPVLTDDDILDFKEQPSVLDSAVNSVSVRYFDPEKKETIVTPPARALALVAAFGTIHQTNVYPEIPTGALATRVAQRDVLASATPTRAFDLVTTRRTYAWRPNQYFRLQAPKRGIADMVCIVGEKQSGTLKSGAIRLKATQDIYSLPATSFVEVEPGVDPRPSETPTPVTLQRAVEAPYVEAAASMTRADLAALPDDVGFALAVAVAPNSELDYTMAVSAAGGIYEEAGNGDWCATATVEEAADPSDRDFTLADGFGLASVEVGMGALWDDEIVRVDAIDAVAGTVTLGRGCADTVPAIEHAAGSRLWFYPTGFAYDSTEFTDGETISIKLLSNTGSQQLPASSATAMGLTFDQRQARPYPPARLRFSDSTQTDVAYPAELSGEVTVSWAHRDRVLQADQLVDTTEASIGPEAGTTYTVTFEQPPGAVVATQSGVTGASATPYTFPLNGRARISVVAARDGLECWQAASHEFDYTLGSVDPVALSIYNKIVAWWDHSGTGGAERLDSHTGGHDAINPTGTYTAGAAAIAAALGTSIETAVATRLDVPHDPVLNLSNDFSVMHWFMRKGGVTQPSFPKLLAKYTDAFNGKATYLLTLDTSNNRLLFRFNAGGSYYDANSGALSDDTAYLAIGTKLAAGSQMYLNSVLVGTQASGGTPDTAADEMRNGASSSTSNDCLIGFFGPAALFEPALTEDERAYLWNDGNGITYAAIAAAAGH